MSSYTHTIIIADCDPLSSREIVSEIKNVTHDTRKLVTHVTIQILVMRYNCSIMTKKILKERYLVTGRMMIHLTSEESGALTILAMREHRDPREQAAYLVRQGLIALNLITEDDNETD